MNKKNFIILSILAVIMASAFTAVTFLKEINNLPLPILGQINNFTLTDENNANFELKQLKGKVWIADFFFTTCSDICPIMTKNMASLSRTFEQLEQIKLISITVNPEFDTPEKIKNYAKQVNKGKNNWLFLTGSRETIRNLLINDFKLGDVKEPIFHSSYFSLVDGHGRIRGYYDGTDKKAIQKLFKDVSQLIKN